MSSSIVGFGEALVDVLPSGEVVGGAPLNFCVRAAQLIAPSGGTASLISRVGDAARGRAILSHLQAFPLDTSAIQVDAQHPTGFVNVSLDDGHPSYEIGQGVAWDHIDATERALELARHADAFCFGTLAQRGPHTRDCLRRCLEAATRAVKIFDINLRQPYPPPELIADSLRHCNVLKCNAEELTLMADWLQLPQAGVQAATDSSQQHAQSRAIATSLQLEFQLDFVFWTQGAAGCVLQRGPHAISADVPRLPAAPDADSVGAGDAASAALAAGLVHAWDDQRIVALANYCGAFAASQRGATTPFPEDFLQQL